MKVIGEPKGRRVWDAPVRVFHWLLVGCFLVAWLSRDARRIDVHAAAGYAIAALLSFRIWWGFVGTATARFASFAASPAAAMRYLRQAACGSAPAYASHNPAGGWSVFALIALGLAVTLTGALLTSAQHGFGPLGGLLDPPDAGPLRAVHDFLARTMLAFVGLHLAGVLLGIRTHRENLVGAMISGLKVHVPEAMAPVPRHATVAVTLAVTVGAGAALFLHATGWMEGYETLRRDASLAAAGTTAPVWREECGSCHLAYPPELLPDRSWRRMLEEGNRHFGEDLGLGPEAVRSLEAAANAGGIHPRRAGLMVRASVPPGESPQRITETAFWRRRHESIDDFRFAAAPVSGRHNCEACHADAASAIFSPRLIRIAE